jgi:alkanesulfonate monooxygenase SsuD/methylene tetrahydromethanopterin reductase-like flavin-dependent oxidoreductase (luciferase family)
MRLGVVILPEFPWSEAREVWKRAEALGFDHAWTYDHLAWRSLRDAPWFGAVATLAAAASATSTIRLGPLVASPNFRHPVSFAREITALDDISGGRLDLGIGAGGLGWDATILGQDPYSPRQRAARFAEFVELLDRLLRQPATNFTGRFYSANEARSAPGCVQQPRVPFAIAATGPRGLQLAARYGDIWVTTGDRSADRYAAAAGAAVVRQQIIALERACARAGRSPKAIRRLVLTGTQLDSGLTSVETFRDTIRQYAAAGVSDLAVHWPRKSDPYAGDPGTFERIITHARP